MSNINLQVFFYHNFVLYRFENCSKLVEKLMVISFNVYLVRNRIVKRLLNFIVKVFSKNWFRQLQWFSSKRISSENGLCVHGNTSS